MDILDMQLVEYDSSIRKKQIRRLLAAYTIVFLIALLLAYSPFFYEGKTLIWSANIDGQTQHYPTLVYIGCYLRQIVANLLHGELAIPLFDLNLAMGSDVIATLNYYGFGNPLYLLSAFVPTQYTEYLYDVLTVVQIYLVGLAFSALCAYHKKPLSHALVGALIYAFSGCVLYGSSHHLTFIDPLIQLPLLLIGVDQIMRRKKPVVFILAVFYSALCGFYFFYMMTLMLGIYVLIRFFDCYGRERVKEFFHMAGRIVGAYLIGIGLAAPIFIPAVVGFLYSDRLGTATVENYFFYDLAKYKKYFLGVIAPRAMSDLDMCMSALAAVVLPAVVLLLLQRKRRRSLKLLLLACVVVYVLPLGGAVMNGFSYPSQRWTFGFALLLSYIVVEMLPALLDLNGKQQLICFVTLLVYSACIFADGSNRSVYYVVGVAMLAITLLTLLLFQTVQHDQGHQKLHSAGSVVCVLIVIVNVSVNGVYRFAQDQGNDVSAHAVHGGETERLQWSLEKEAGEFYGGEDGRLDSSSFTYNYGAVWGTPNMHTYWSIVNKDIVEFFLKTENASQENSGHTIMGTDERTGIDALLSTKFFIDRADRTQYVPYGYWPLGNTPYGNLIYINQYATSWGYTYDSYISYEQMEAMNGLQVEEAMLQSIALEESVGIVPKGEVESDIQELNFEITGLDNVEWSDGVLTVMEDNAAMTLEFQMPAGAEGYLRLEKFDINQSGRTSFNVTVECAEVSKTILLLSSDYTWYFGRENYLVNLGYSEEGRSSCTIFFPRKGIYRLGDIQLFALPMERYPDRIKALCEGLLGNIEFGTNRITGTVDLSKNKILCLSVPYSSGWTARVDGKKVDILRGNYMFMALPLEAGHHEIEFTYFTPGLKAGLICCGISAGLLGYYLFREKRKKASLI